MQRVSHPMFRPQQVDSSTVVRAGVGVVIRDELNRVLLEKRSDCGLWGLPGGRIEPGESARDTAIREVREETGLVVRITGLMGVYSEAAERVVTFPERVVQLIDIIINAEVVSGALQASTESEALRFFYPHELPQDVAPPARQILEDVRAGHVCVLR